MSVGPPPDETEFVQSCHVREGGKPEGHSNVWMLAFAGVAGRRLGKRLQVRDD